MKEKEKKHNLDEGEVFIWQAYGSIFLLILTVALVICQPRGLNIGWSAMIGGLIALVLGFVALHDLITIFGLIWNATFTLIAIFVISMFLQDIGFFDWSALKMMRLSRGNGSLYFFYLIILGALITAFFPNDGTALILTPIILAKMRLMGFGEKMIFPLLISAGFLADTASLPLVTSNLTNILSADYFNISYAAYASRMFLTNIASVFMTYLTLFALYRKSIPKRFSIERMAEPFSQVQDPFLFKVSWILLVLLFAFCFTNQFFHFPLSMIFCFCAICFMVFSKARGRIQPLTYLKEAPWEIIFFSIGMYVVVYGVHNSQGFGWVEDGIYALEKEGLFTSIMGFGFIASFLSSIFNNLPIMVFNMLAIDAAHLDEIVRDGMIYANLVGCNVGTKLTPIGSLGTLLWLYVLKKHEVYISWGYYCKIALILILPTVFVTLLVLWIEMELIP